MPAITEQPRDIVATMNETVTFSVRASGSEPFHFTWKKDDSAIGFNSSNLTLVNVQPVNAGRYTVTISNDVGSVESADATLFVQSLPPDATVPDAAVPDATVPDAAVPDAAVPDAAVPDAAVPDAAVPDAADKGAEALRLWATNVVTLPRNQSVVAGEDVVFVVDMRDDSLLTYQWFKGDVVVSSNSNTFILNDVSAADTGDYVVTVRNEKGQTVSAPFTLIVNTPPPPEIIAQPQNQRALVNGTATFTVVATTMAPLTYQWSKNGEAISGATTACYTTSTLSLDDNGDIYSVVVRNSGGGVSSQSATLFVSIDDLPAFGVLTGPYLQNVKTNEMTIMWETSTSDADYIEYGVDTTYGAEKTSEVFQSGGDQTWIHKVTLSPLIPNTTYHYRVRMALHASRDYTFVTAPESSKAFSFGVWGDSQGSTDNPTNPDEPTLTLMRHMASVEKVDFAISTGDLASNGQSASSVRRAFLDRAVRHIGTRVPFFITWGNHDGPKGSLIRNYVTLPKEDNYSFDYADCHFVCIDFYSADATLPVWLKRDLDSDSAKAAKFIFFFIHAAPWYERWYPGEAWLRDTVIPLLENSQVAVSFSGHVHEYERGRKNGVYYVTTGGGSWLEFEDAPIYDWEHITVGGYSNPPPDPINHGLINEYVKVEVVGRLATVKMLGFSVDGSYLGVLDTFQIVR
jgi:predicted phosphodiesterase